MDLKDRYPECTPGVQEALRDLENEMRGLKAETVEAVRDGLLQLAVYEFVLRNTDDSKDREAACQDVLNFIDEMEGQPIRNAVLAAVLQRVEGRSQ